MLCFSQFVFQVGMAVLHNEIFNSYEDWNFYVRKEKRCALLLLFILFICQRTFVSNQFQSIVQLD